MAAPLCLVLSGCGGAVDIAPPDPSARADAACQRLARQLPQRVAGEELRETDPASRLSAAWGDPPLTMRCGVAKPREYTKTAQLFAVNGVAWLPTPQDAELPTTYYVVEREAYIRLEVPADHQPAADALVDLGKAVKKAVPKDPSARP